MRRRDYDEIIETRGYRFGVRYEHDPDAGTPWENSDGHGPVSEWTTREKGPGERVIATDRSHKRYYDWAEAIRIAKRDGWGVGGGRLEGETAKAYRARAVAFDYEFLRGWCRDEWHYEIVTVEWADDPDISASLGSVESSGTYPREVADELIDELLSRIEVETPDVVLSEN